MRGAITSGLRMLAPVVVAYAAIVVLSLTALFVAMRVSALEAVAES